MEESIIPTTHEPKHIGEPFPGVFLLCTKKVHKQTPPSTPFPKILIFFVDNPKHIQYNEVTVEPVPSGAFQGFCGIHMDDLEGSPC